MNFPQDPERDCDFCPRLVEFRQRYRASDPGWFNAPVPTFRGETTIRLLIVGLAPGLKGANKTGRPFTGDFAGDLLYETLLDFGFAEGQYKAVPDDGLNLTDCAITNAVRCVPPENKPNGAEIKACRPFLLSTIGQMDGLLAYLALGRIAHDTLLTALGLRRASFPFGHGARHTPGSGPVIFDSYHCSRYNTNTGRLTREMFRGVFEDIRNHIDQVAG